MCDGDEMGGVWLLERFLGSPCFAIVITNFEC